MYLKINYQKLKDVQNSLKPILLNAKSNVNKYCGNIPIDLQDFIDLLGAEPVTQETLRMPPKPSTHCHRDLYAGIKYIWSVNIPVLGYEDSYTAFWKTKGPPSTPKGLYVWNIDRCRMLSKYNTDRIFIMDTRIPHSISNTKERFTYMLRMPMSWDPNILGKYIDYDN